jgi:hypothetical protein
MDREYTHDIVVGYDEDKDQENDEPNLLSHFSDPYTDRFSQ